jgi:SAM-dependent methyltransferase
MVLPELNSEYGTLKYWEERYSTEQEIFDWFKGFGDIKEKIFELIEEKELKILHLGCGNSSLGEEMYADGYKNIVNLDYSPKVIDFMASRCSQMVEMTWITADIFKMDECKDLGIFDIALDKGTLDALLTCKHDPWNPHQELCDEISLYMEQVSKKLKLGGKFLHITFCQPHFRQRFLEIASFKVSVHKLSSAAGGFEYFCYEAVKIR